MATVRPGVEEFVRSRRYVLAGRGDRFGIWEVGKEAGPPVASFPMEDEDAFDQAAQVFDRLVAANRWDRGNWRRFRDWIGPFLPAGEPREEDRVGGALLAAIGFIAVCASVATWITAGSDMIGSESQVSGLRVGGRPVLAAGVVAFVASLLLIAHVRSLRALSVTTASGSFIFVYGLARALSLSVPLLPFSWRVVGPAPWIAAAAGGVMLAVSLGLLFRRSSFGPTPSLSQIVVFVVTCAGVVTTLVIEDWVFGCSPSIHVCAPRDRTILRIGIIVAMLAAAIAIVALSRARRGERTP
jgi:hypothetical protein